MRPALSVVAFTVLAGAGIGVLVLVALLDLIAIVRTSAGTADQSRIAALGWILVVVGLLSSVLHLGRPTAAWRSLSRLATSWLSREGLASLLLVGTAFGWIVAMHFDAHAIVRALLSIATLVLAWVTLYCTAMIYASLKPIRQWHTQRVPLVYFVLSHLSGAIIVVGWLRAIGEPTFVLAIVTGALVIAAAWSKVDYYAYIASDAHRLSIEDAIGVPQGVGAPRGGTVMRARLLDVGHSRGTFLTREFDYRLVPAQRVALRTLFWFAGLLVPALWLAFGLDDWHAAIIASLACFAGLGAERWLFFAEARHTVRLYHGHR
ncbi:MAG TPA: DmsC/YnfH family molybdoenzyme membrane anchor subunit, partial [Casimicrobiaceae bacterium]|nr:DmsC/YnfH family molybdoenzyme membrane anchor subunit [Casimicrobiaceae bacterium]